MSIVLALMVSFLWKSVFAEEAPTAEGVSMAATLIGSISFVMCLYYFINYDDKDIQEMSWQTISGTISIFCAVLAFSSINDLMEAYVITPIFGEGDATMGALLVDFLHMIAWFVFMQYALAKLSGAVDSDADQAEREALRGEEAEPSEAFEKVLFGKKENMACYAVLCAHITGFASINCFGTVQQIFFSESPGMAFLTPLSALIFMLLMQRITDHVRESIAMSGDGKKDEFEDLWDEECEEAENDVMGLALSFTFVSALRFAITGCLPNQEGKEEECAVEEYLYKHTFDQKAMLLGSGVVFAIVIFVMRSNWPAWLEEEGGEEEEEEAEGEEKLAKTPEQVAELEKKKAEGKRVQFYGRFAEGVFVAVSMSFSWSFFFGTQMVLAGYSFFNGEEEMMAVALALLISAVCLGGILPLDKLADQDWTDEHCDMAIRSLMEAMAILIGFAWEQCFDASVDQIAQKTNEMDIDGLNQHSVKFFLTLFCCILLIPAWKMYMIPFMVAEGWKYDFPLRIEDVHRVAEQMMDRDAEDAKKEEPAEGDEPAEVNQAEVKATQAKIAKMKKVLGTIAAVVDDHEEKTNAKAGGAAPIGKTAGSYKELPGDDVTALKKQNADIMKQNGELRAEADKAKAACLKAQKMLDTTMESMLSSMKHMNETVARIESTA